MYPQRQPINAKPIEMLLKHREHTMRPTTRTPMQTGTLV
nr:MAG TPA: hypothetical protein [Caudoviricetes sp.]